MRIVVAIARFVSSLIVAGIVVMIRGLGIMAGDRRRVGLPAVAAGLAAEGHVSRKGVPFFAAQVSRMLADYESSAA